MEEKHCLFNLPDKVISCLRLRGAGFTAYRDLQRYILRLFTTSSCCYRSVIAAQVIILFTLAARIDVPPPKIFKHLYVQ